jgi:hypothetical protein
MRRLPCQTISSPLASLSPAEALTTVRPDLTSAAAERSASSSAKERRRRRPAVALLTGAGVGLGIGLVYSFVSQALGST